MGNRTDGAGVHFQSKHIKINIQKDFVCVSVLDYLCLIFFFCQRLKLSLFCISLPQERSKERISAMFAALQLHPCSLISVLMAKDHSAFKKGLGRSFFHREESSSGEKRNWKSKGKISGCREGCAARVKPWGREHMGRGTGDLGDIVPPWERAVNLLWVLGNTAGFISPKSTLIFPQKTLSSANSIPAHTHPPLPLRRHPHPRHCDPLEGRYHLGETTDNLEKKHAWCPDYIEILLAVSVTLIKMGVPK